jgi:hypothetical protein
MPLIQHPLISEVHSSSAFAPHFGQGLVKPLSSSAQFSLVFSRCLMRCVVSFKNDRTVGSSRWLVFVGSLDDTSGEVQGPANTRESLHFQGY